MSVITAILTFISGVCQSIAASALFSLYKSEKAGQTKAAFDKRVELFHSKISPHLIEHVIPNLSQKIADELHKETIGDKKITCPFFYVINSNELAISSDLRTNINHFPINENFIRWFKVELKKRADNKPTFCLNGISSKNELSLCISDYYSTLSTSDIHYFNLIKYFPIESKLWSSFAYKHSKYVGEWIASLNKIIDSKSFSHYAASVGCAVMTVLKGIDGKYKYLLKMNSDKKNSAKERHVIPSFMFQPIADRPYEQERELDLQLAVVREYGEELLEIKEMESAESVDSLLHNITKHPLLNKLKDSIEDKSVFLEATGLIVDIYRLRPEITLLLILDEDDYSKQLNTNWETEERTLDHIDLYDDDSFYEIITSKTSPIAPPGLAALINGRKKAIEIISAREACESKSEESDSPSHTSPT
ncbi:MAG: hypothetical protein OET90_03880 [Desulfuromonadales bacterium]|nr:hypothetical protein [Desulfuromonadales bacterium]